MGAVGLPSRLPSECRWPWQAAPLHRCTHHKLSYAVLARTARRQQCSRSCCSCLPCLSTPSQAASRSYAAQVRPGWLCEGGAQHQSVSPPHTRRPPHPLAIAMRACCCCRPCATRTTMRSLPRTPTGPTSRCVAGWRTGLELAATAACTHGDATAAPLIAQALAAAKPSTAAAAARWLQHRHHTAVAPLGTYSLAASVAARLLFNSTPAVAQGAQRAAVSGGPRPV